MAAQIYDPDVFDSMAVVNSEEWNKGGSDGEKLTRAEILPQGVTELSRRQMDEAFLTAAENGAVDVMRELHTLCGDDIITIRDSDLYTPLHRASYNGHLSAVEYLLSNGGRVDAETVDGWQPLHCACRWNKTSVADLLLQNRALINAQTHGKQTPLHLAAANDRARRTLILLLMNPDLRPDLVNGQGDTALDIAHRHGNHAHLFLMVDPSVDYRKFLATNDDDPKPPS